MSLRWKLSRLSTMGGAEIAYRVSRALQSQAERLTVRTTAPRRIAETSGNPWVHPIPTQFDIGNYRAAADRILAGKFDIFAMKGAELGFPPRWNTDPKTGITAPLTFGKTLNYRDSSVVGDIKYLWEPNRHLELVTLAQAAHLSGDARYADGCRTLLESWFDQCPYPLGVNWTSSLEHALRLVQWSIVWHLLGGNDSALFKDAAGNRFKERWLACIYHHCRFIAGYLSRHSSSNNHLLGELCGLFVGTTTWPMWDESSRWRALAHLELESEALRQNFADGVNREQAVWYHQAVAQMMLVAGLFGRANACDFGQAYWRRLEGMMDFILSVMDVGAGLPPFGDADDGTPVRLSVSSRQNPYLSLLAAGAVIFERSDFRRKVREFDDTSRWLFGEAGAGRFESMPTSAATGSVIRSFPLGGYYILGDAFDKPDEVKIVCRAGPFGYLSIAAHAHADLLSFTLTLAGMEMLIDSGTYAYHTNESWRKYFRGTAAHNALRIDEEDQSVSGGAFMWTRHANARVLAFESENEISRLVAEHDGYRRLPDPVGVRRELVYDRNVKRLTINDSVDGRMAHQIELFWHFSQECHVQISAGTAIARRAGRAISIAWPYGMRARLISGQEDPPLGWRSEHFDCRVPCTTLVLDGHSNGSWRGTSQIDISPPESES